MPELPLLFEPKDRAKPILLGLAILLVAIVGGGVGYFSKPVVATGPPPAIVAAETFVRYQLGPGIQLEFSPREWTKVENLGPNHYLVRGWVSALSGKGSSIAYNYSCELERKQDGDLVAKKIDLVAQ